MRGSSTNYTVNCICKLVYEWFRIVINNVSVIYP